MEPIVSSLTAKARNSSNAHEHSVRIAEVKMSRHSAAFLVSCLCIAVSLAGDFKSVVIPETGPTLTVVVPDKHFLRIHNFTQEGTATQRGVVIVNPSTPTPTPTPTPTGTPTPTVTPTATPTPTPTATRHNAPDLPGFFYCAACDAWSRTVGIRGNSNRRRFRNSKCPEITAGRMESR